MKTVFTAAATDAVSAVTAGLLRFVFFVSHNKISQKNGNSVKRPKC